MNNINKLMRIIIIQGVATAIIFLGVIVHYENKINKINETNDIFVSNMNTTNFIIQQQLDTYTYLYKSQEDTVKEFRVKYNQLNDDYTKLKNQIYLSKEREKKISRGDYPTKNLSTYAIMTVDEMNEWISKRAPKDSPFIGRGAVFLKASAESRLDPKYLVAHAGLESAWGMSQIARIKNNYFGIGSYNATPFESSYKFNDSLEAGITQGAAWIKENYFNKGRTTLETMQQGKGAYCQLANGVPDLKWIDQISSIVYK